MRTWMGLFTLALGAWLAATVGWAAVADRTPLPGPAKTAERSARLLARAVTAPPWPGPLARPPQALARGIRRSGEAVGRLYRGPERVAARLFGCDEAAPAPDAWSAPNAPRPLAAPRAPGAPRSPAASSGPAPSRASAPPAVEPAPGAAVAWSGSATDTRIRADVRIDSDAARERLRGLVRRWTAREVRGVLERLQELEVVVVVN